MDGYDFQIRFQNTGTDTAFTIVVRDTLDDISNPTTLQTIASSHNYTFSLEKNEIAVWTFNDILLPDSFRNELKSHGFVKFSIKTKTTPLSIGTLLKNKASIFFDYNEPVLTNEVQLKVVNKFTTPTQDISLISRVYPNPTRDKLIVDLANDAPLSTLALYNAIGELVRTENLFMRHNTLIINDLPNGLYQLVIQQGDKKQTTSVIVQHW